MFSFSVLFRNSFLNNLLILYVSLGKVLFIPDYHPYILVKTFINIFQLCAHCACHKVQDPRKPFKPTTLDDLTK